VGYQTNRVDEAPEVFSREAMERQQAGALLVDVREQLEYDEVRAPGVFLMPLSVFTQRFRELPQDRELLMICHSGYRSAQAANFLLRHGYPNASNVVGGMEEWEVAGLPVERGVARRA
jgi:rhodanese-related sulfurtransferase